MKHNFLILAFALLSSVQVAFAEVYSGTCGNNLNWSLDTETGAFVITGSGAMDSYTSPSLIPWQNYKSFIKSISLPSGLTSICKNAFNNCDSITSIYIPDNVSSIGENAFMSCENLLTANVPAKMTYIAEQQFKNCSNLKTFEIPRRIKYIGAGAFTNTGLTTVFIPDSASFGSNSTDPTPFKGCELTAINVSNEHLYYCTEDGVLYNKQKTRLLQYPAAKPDLSFSIPSSITVIERYVFYEAKYLTYITIPNSITSIEYRAFLRCQSLSVIDIPNSVTSIASGAFSGCSSLKSVKLTESITKINSDLFYNCSSLTSIKIPEGVTTISNYAFENCTSLEVIEFPSSITYIGLSFYNCPNINAIHISDLSSWCPLELSGGINSPYNLYLQGELVTNLVIPDDVTTIGFYIFHACSSIESVTLGSNVKTIKGGAFRDCSNLTSITFNDKISNIEGYAFYGCQNLAYVNINDIDSWCSIDFQDCYAQPLYYAHKLYLNGIPVTDVTLSNKITKIGNYAFYSYIGLDTVSIPNSVTYIGSNAFYNCKDLQFHILSESIDSIGVSAFGSCSNLTICVPATAEIGSNAFSGCKKVVYYSDRIGEYWFNDTILTGYTGNETELAFPSTHNGATYTIGASVFEKLNTPISSISIPNAVTSIGNYAFRNVRTLKKVELPVNLTDIATNAFYNCDSIASVSMGMHESTPSIKTLFSSSINKSLKEFIALEGSTLVGTKIGGNNHLMFANNRVIERIKIPRTVHYIADSTFMNCSNLESVVIGYTNEQEAASHINAKKVPTSNRGNIDIYDLVVGQRSFKDVDKLVNLVLHEGVQEIVNNAFERCDNITSVNIPKSVTKIGTEAFVQCTELKDVIMQCDFQALATYTGSDAKGGQFDGCKKIKNIKLKQNSSLGKMQPLTTVFSNSLDSIETLEWIGKTKIDDTTFPGSDTICWTNAVTINQMGEMPNLQHVTIPEGISGIGDGAFKGATLLTQVELPSTLNFIGSGAFMNTGISGTFTLPKNVKTIGSFVLANCNSLQILLIGCVNMTTIPYYFCGGCINLDSVDYLWYGRPENICKPKTIGPSAFADCTSLRKIIIPSSVEEIQTQAFSNCINVNDLRVEAITPPICRSVSGDPFKGVKRNGTLVVPEGTKESYASSVYVWKEFYNVFAFHQQKENLQSAETTAKTTQNSVNVSWAEHNNASAYDVGIKENGTDEERSFTVAAYQTENFQAPARRVKMEEGIPGIVFSLTGLKPNTEYSYTITAFDENKEILSVDSGYFWTQRPLYYAIRFLNWDGEILQTDSVESDSIPVYTGDIPTRPKDENYTYEFRGWSPTIVAATTDTDYIAQFDTIAIPYYTIRFLNWDGAVLQTMQVKEDSIPIYTGATPTRPADEKYTYEFSGWSPTIVAATTDTDYIAQFDSIAIPYYTIRFLNWNGAVLQLTQVKEDDMPVYTGATPTRPVDEQYTYEFSGWSPDIVVATADKDYTAQYTAQKKQVGWQACGDNLLWKVEERALIITGFGDMWNYFPREEGYTGYAPWDTNITSVSLPDGLTGIGSDAFSGCADLTTIQLPNNLQKIEVGAFWNCLGLTTIDIPASVNYIGEDAFGACYGLTNINVDANNANYCSIDGVLFDKAATTLLQYPFGKAISTYTIPNGVTTIGYGVFSYYYSNNVSIVIPSTVTNIGDYAFFDASLKSLTCEAATPPALGTDAFYGYVYSATLYVPGQSINTYKSTKGWKSFYKIQAIPVATGIEKEIHVDISPRENAKILRDGQIYILRGEKVYTITGQEVK